MFDVIDVFAKQFTPIDGGYLYYPSKKSGGKLVTAAEYDELVEGMRKAAGRPAIWKVVGVVLLVILTWALISEAQSLPDWADWIVVAAVAIGISAWTIWASLAPQRLVRDRPFITPPRTALQAGREVRSLLGWRFIIFALLFSGFTFFGSLYSTERNFVSWAVLFGTGAIFGGYIWISVRKFRDG